MNLLNYKYEIFPTKPQRSQLYRILRESKYQWNKAVTIRRKLKAALVSGQFEYVVRTCLSLEKSNTQGQRVSAIEKFRSQYPEMEFETAARCYDIKNLIGKVLGDISPETLLDVKSLAEKLKAKHKEEVANGKEAVAKGTEKKLPKLSVFWQMMGAINRYAGYAAKVYMDKSFEPSMSLSNVRFNISGSANSHRWNRAVQPSKNQRAYGAKGEPQYKRRGDGFSYQIPQGTETADLFRSKSHSRGQQIFINTLHEGNRWIDAAYHRQIPEGSKIKQMTVNERAGHFFVALSCEVPDSAWAIAPMQAGWYAGIDPGAQTALTVGLHNSQTGEVRHAAIDYRFLEKSLDMLEKFQQNLAKKHGPKRKRTVAEVNEALAQFSSKRKIQKLPEEKRSKTIAKEKELLEKRMIPQQASISWKKASRKVGEFQYKIANRRLDVLHKISRALAEGCDVVGIGHWEPEREVSYRKKKRALMKQVKANVAGAKDALDALEQEKSKQGPKGVKKIRRGGRDRSIATLRRLVEEKAQRAGTFVCPDINESGSTMTCCICGKKTGPTGKENLSVREWRCSECSTLHHRDLNSAFNILLKTKEEFTAAQAASPAETTERDAARTTTHGTMVQSGDSSAGFHVRGSFGKGGLLFKNALPDLWQGEAPKAFQSLIQMGVVRPAAMQEAVKNSHESPP